MLNEHPNLSCSGFVTSKTVLSRRLIDRLICFRVQNQQFNQSIDRRRDTALCDMCYAVELVLRFAHRNHYAETSPAAREELIHKEFRGNIARGKFMDNDLVIPRNR